MNEKCLILLQIVPNRDNLNEMANSFFLWMYRLLLLVLPRLYSKTCENGHSQKDRKLFFKTNYHLMRVKSIAECSKGSILQYFRPSLSYHLSLRHFFFLFLSCYFAQVLLYNLYFILQDSLTHFSQMNIPSLNN